MKIIILFKGQTFVLIEFFTFFFLVSTVLYFHTVVCFRLKVAEGLKSVNLKKAQAQGSR